MTSPRESETRLPGRRPAQSALLPQPLCGSDSCAHLSFQPLTLSQKTNKFSAQLHMTSHRTEAGCSLMTMAVLPVILLLISGALAIIFVAPVGIGFPRSIKSRVVITSYTVIIRIVVVRAISRTDVGRTSTHQVG